MRNLVPLTLFTLLLVCLPGCDKPSQAPSDNTSPLPPGPPPTPVAADQTPSATSTLSHQLNLRCDDAATGRGCTLGNLEAGDFYDVELTPDCGTQGFFAGVAAASATLLDTLPVTGSHARDNAIVAQGQFVCVQAIARAGQQPAYYYVATVPIASVAACEGKQICKHYGDRPVKLSAQPISGVACTLTASGQPTGDCAHGWVSADALEAFSNGL